MVKGYSGSSEKAATLKICYFLNLAMVVSCSAYGCTNRRIHGTKLTFHRIPKDPILKASWIQAIRRKDWIPTKNSYVCSEHFKENDFNRTYACKRALLREDAVPSLFKGFHSYPSEAKKVHASKQGKKFKIPEYHIEENVRDKHISNRSDSFLKWKKYAEIDNTEVVMQKLNCPEITAFENQWKSKYESSEKERESDGDTSEASTRENNVLCEENLPEPPLLSRLSSTFTWNLAQVFC